MPIIHTEDLTPSTPLSASHNKQVYCGLDCGIMVEVREELASTYGGVASLEHGLGKSNREPDSLQRIYDFERALQGPYLEIMLRGFRVDDGLRRRGIASLERREEALQKTLDALASVVWSKWYKDKETKQIHALNPRSPTQLKDFFYTTMGLPEVWINQKGERKLSTNREALEKLEQYMFARPICATILKLRELSKQRSILESEVDQDGRMRTSYNIAGTSTGRASSSANAFGTGTNLMNIPPHLRVIFTADPGKKLCVIDLSQVEARDVGFIIGCLFGDWTYLDNCESSDLHTNTAKRVWPNMPWTGDPKADRKLADKNFYREFTYRDMAKRGAHLSNYMGGAWMAARHLKMPVEIMEAFHAAYFGAFPGIPMWWRWTAEQLQLTHTLTTLFGRRSLFFGRPGDDTTLREAIAFQPQGTTADRTNLALLRMWRKMPEVQILGQTYDSVTFQYDDRGHDYESTLMQRALACFDVPIWSPSGRRYTVPGEAKIGWNWGNAHDASKPTGPGNRWNPEGLTKWSPSRPDLRVRGTGLKAMIPKIG